MSAREAIDSPIPQQDGSILRTFIIEGTTDDAQAEAIAFAAASPSYRGRIRTGYPSISVPARGVWEAEFSYIPPGTDTGEPSGDEPTLGTIEIDSSGGTQHVTQCYDTAFYGAFAAEQVARATALWQARVVGFHRDGVNGVDIDVPGTVYTLTRKWLPQAISGAYLYNLSRLRGKINYYPWTLNWAAGSQAYSIYFEPAELRFLGYRANIGLTKNGLSCWDISYMIHHSANVYGLPVSSTITIPFKGGQHYMWTLYKKQAITGGTIEVPDVVFQSRVYDWEDFGSVMGF